MIRKKLSQLLLFVQDTKWRPSQSFSACVALPGDHMFHTVLFWRFRKLHALSWARTPTVCWKEGEREKEKTNHRWTNRAIGRDRHFWCLYREIFRILYVCTDKLQCNVSMFVWLWLSTSNAIFKKLLPFSCTDTHSGYKKNCLCTVSTKQMGFCSQDLNTATVSGSLTITDCSALAMLSSPQPLLVCVWAELTIMLYSQCLV